MSSLNKFTDSELLVLLKENNSRAFTEIYNRYWEKLFTVAGNKLQAPFPAQELVQEFFLDIWKRRANLTLSDQIDRYLATALKYKIINIRHKKTIEQRYLDYAKQKDAQSYYSMESYLQFEELKERLEKLVKKLPEHS